MSNQDTIFTEPMWDVTAEDLEQRIEDLNTAVEQFCSFKFTNDYQNLLNGEFSEEDLLRLQDEMPYVHEALTTLGKIEDYEFTILYFCVNTDHCFTEEEFNHWYSGYEKQNETADEPMSVRDAINARLDQYCNERRVSVLEELGAGLISQHIGDLFNIEIDEKADKDELYPNIGRFREIIEAGLIVAIRDLPDATSKKPKLVIVPGIGIEIEEFEG
jgi:hypothetical protein